MKFFFFAFFFLYSLLHFYILIKAKYAFGLQWSHLVIVAPILILLVFSPLIIREADKQGFDTIAKALSYIGYTWMGLLVLFCFISISIDFMGFLFGSNGILLRLNPLLYRPAKNFSFIISSIFSIILTIYGFFEARDIKVERHRIITPKVHKKIRIVQISDVHIGLIIDEKRVKRILDLVKQEEPDILVSTGDLVDGQIDSLSKIAEEFKKVSPPYGKYAVTGNHEFYAGLKEALEFIEGSGFKVLRGKGLTVLDMINIAGVDDPAGKAYGLYVNISEKKLLSGLPKGMFTLLLKHRPIVNEESIGFFDLQLSGHTHKGQIFPFSLITKLYYPHHAGGMNLRGDAYLYVSRGTGTWGPPIRFLSPPEITVFDLVPSKNRNQER